MTSLVDIIFIIILFITILIIIGINLTNSIKTKQKETKIVVNICKDLKGKLIVDIDGNLKSENVEKFIVDDANDFHSYQEQRKQAIKNLSNSFDDEKIDTPLEQDKVDYDKDKDDRDFYIGMTYDFKPIKASKRKDERNKKLYVSNMDFGWEPPRQYVSCANNSISQQFKTGEKSLMPYQIDCTRPNKLTAENYYKTHYKAHVIPIEDKLVRGHNYMEYSSWVEPTKIDFRILSQTTKGLPLSEKLRSIPVGFNYGFHNTPAMTMP